MEQIRILIADDHPIVRAGLKTMLGTQPDFLLIGEASTGLEAVQLTLERKPQIVLMDLRMPELNGVDATQRIKAEVPTVQILVLTTYDSDIDIIRAVEAGASGYLLKDAPYDDLFRAIRDAAQGELAPHLILRVNKIREQAEHNPLSQREMEVLTLAARGESNRVIAERLAIGESTIKTHMIKIFSKLGVDNRTAAVTTALERGWISLEE